MTGLLTRGLGFAGPLVTRGLGGVAPATVPDLRAALVAYLLADGTLASLVGSRLHPGYRPQGEAVPALCYAIRSNARRRALNGTAGFSEAKVDLTVWALSVADCVRVKARLEDLLDNQVGSWSGLFVRSFQEDEGDDHVWPDDGSASSFTRLLVTYSVRHRTRLA